MCQCDLAGGVGGGKRREHISSSEKPPVEVGVCYYIYTFEDPTLSQSGLYDMTEGYQFPEFYALAHIDKYI